MRKLLSVLVIALFFIGSIPFGGTLPGNTKAANENKQATMMAIRLYPAHATREGKVIGCDTANFAYSGSDTCPDCRSFPWERKGTNNWGRYSPGDTANSYLMPFGPKASDAAGTPVPVRTDGIAASYPKAWGECYLDVSPDGSKSQELKKWYIVLDSGGQIWFDPDGQFNDPRYDATADPQSNTYTPGNVTSNVMSRMDPVKSNNTQGPYIIDQTNPSYQPKIYFWDRNTELKAGSNRSFRLGWVDAPEYIREGGIDYKGKVSTGIVGANEWEVSSSVNWAWNPYKCIPVVPTAATLNAARFITTPQYFDTYYDANSNGRYDADEFIYRKGNALPIPLPPAFPTPNTALLVQAGDFRLTATSVSFGGETFSYPPHETDYVDIGNKDIGLVLTPFAYPLGGIVETRYFDRNVDGKFNPGEYIYRVSGTLSRIKGGDIRLTNVFVTGNYVSSNPAFSNGAVFSENDVLLLNEVLHASSDGSKYDISVQSNVWMGESPSTTAAALRTPNGEFPLTSQRIQKNTVLDPTGSHFEVPASTFHDIQPLYRSYLGYQIFRDNGVDNNRGVNLPTDLVIPQSLSDEYKSKRIGEEYLGASDGSSGTPDFGRPLTAFDDYVLYYDANYKTPLPGDPNNRFGCGEALYEKKDKIVPSPADRIVQVGDKRLTEITTHNGNMISYPPGSIVLPGDVDVNSPLQVMYTTIPSSGQKQYFYKYYDEFIYNQLNTDDKNLIRIQTKIYEPGETIYYDANNNAMVDLMDVRLTEGFIGGFKFDCGSVIVNSAEYWFNQSYIRMLSMGQNGDPRFIDIEVVPGLMDLKVDIDKPLKVEQTSTMKLSLGSDFNLKAGEKIFISVREPKESEITGRPPKKLFEETISDPSPTNYTGVTPGMTNISASYYIYYGTNFVYGTTPLWGLGASGFKIDGESYDNMCITEDGMVGLYKGYPNIYPDSGGYYPYEYRYDYLTLYGYAYGGRPYPFSAAGNDCYYSPYGYVYNGGARSSNCWASNYYDDAYVPWDSMMMQGTWIIPLGGQWHIPRQDIWSYPGYYFDLAGYGVWFQKTNDYVKVVWKVCTQPFSVMNYFYQGYGGTVGPGLASNRSEFEMIIYKAGLITFNYSMGGSTGTYGMNMSPDFVRANDHDFHRSVADFFVNPDTNPYGLLSGTPSPSVIPNRWVTYKPIIGVSTFFTHKQQVSKLSYGGSSPMPNLRYLAGRSITFGPPEASDEDLYNKKIFTAFGVIDKDHPVYEFQYTPYRGSANDGYHGMNGFKAGTSLFNQLEIRAFLDKGGFRTPVPIDSDFTGSFSTNYRDPFWIRSKFNKKEWQENYRREPIFVVPPEPIDAMPSDLGNYSVQAVTGLATSPIDTYNKGYLDLRNTYDCYSLQKFDIAPEAIKIIPDKKCLDLVSSKTPNISYQVIDADNPNDVNDPANLQMMFPLWFAGDGQYLDPATGLYDYGVELVGTNQKGKFGRPMIMNFNAHGAGIDYMFSAQCGDGMKYKRYIVQVNTDGSYDFWRWFEFDLPGQVFGALDQHDMLYTARGTYIPTGGQWDMVSGGNTSYLVPDSWRLPAQFLEDMDGSFNQGSCTYLNDMFPPFGDVTSLDRYGMFGSSGLRNNPAGDTGFGDASYYFPYPYPSSLLVPTAIQTFGIPVVIMSPEINFAGGIGLGVAKPQNSDTPLTIRLYSNNVIFDYNSTMKHPPHFTYDPGEGIDYLGYQDIRILPIDPILNFADMTIADRSLQLSKVNYTAGINALSPLEPPTPQLKSDYNPILYDWAYLRAYPGGQTHTGRAMPLDSSIRFKGEGRNATTAIYDIYKKLGTEFFPLTDYGIFFSIRDAEKNHYSFDPALQANLILAKVTIKGPFIFPKCYSPGEAKIDTAYRYKGIDNVPIQYDTSGEITIDQTNAANWEGNSKSYNRVINLYRSMPRYIPVIEKNKYARYTHSLYFGGVGATYSTPPTPHPTTDQGGWCEGDMPNSSSTTPAGQYYYYYNYYYGGWYFYSPTATYNTNYVPNQFSNYDARMMLLDEIIPVGPGKITIEVETSTGIKKTYQDCCQDNVKDGIPVEGLDIHVDSPKEFTVDADNSLDITVSEFDKKMDNDATILCNDALLVAWQDRGALEQGTGSLMGAGDGWLTNPPRSSDYTNLGTSFLPDDDINGNGKVSFNDWETEILGSYDLATNTWSSGIIDGRTFHRGAGKYHMELTQNNGSRLDTVGMDFGGLNVRATNAITKPDGVIGDDEVLPVIINAYKFGDDNNDRAFTPLTNIKGEYPQYSHEVYLSGRAEIQILPQNTYSLTINPETLTAGIQPELQDPTEPLTFNLNDESGAPVDLLKDAHKMIVGVPDEDIDELSLRSAIWNALFKDPHPEPLPQYYWIRTDLHNDDGTVIGNTEMYSSDAGRFVPIFFDITQSAAGKYLFKGFVANDAGETDIMVYSPDRRKMGKAKLKVALPNVTYKVSNYDDPDKTLFDVPGDPDFTMTAGDNMIYKVRVNVKDAQGRPVVGLGRSVTVCGGSAQEVARFTPFITAHKNYYRQIEPWYWHFYGLYGDGNARWIRGNYYNGSYYKYQDMAFDYPERWDVNIGVDTNANGKLDLINNEIERTRPMRQMSFATNMYGSYYNTVGFGYQYYNTENFKYDNETYNTDIAFDINNKLNPFPGWGPGCIYNRPYYTPGNLGLIFANLDKMGNDNVTSTLVNISNTDSLNLNVDGETEFYVFGEDVCEVGGLTGKSMWSISPFGDIAGSPVMYFPGSPTHMRTRFGRRIVLPAGYRGRTAYTAPLDRSYRLDWDGMPSNVIKIRPPVVEPVWAETGMPVGKTMLDENSYDLVYGQENHVLFRFYPADKRDIRLKDDILMMLFGNQSEYRISGRLAVDQNKPEEPSSTTMFITPTGTGLTSLSLDLVVNNTRKDEYMRLTSSYGSNGAFSQNIPVSYFVTDIARFDVLKGLNVLALSLSGPLSMSSKAKLKIVVTEVGTKKPIEGAQISLTGSGIKESRTTDADGIAYIDVTPTAKEAIVITATKEGYIPGSSAIDIGAVSDRKDLLQMNPIPQKTKEAQYPIEGTVSPDVLSLSINTTKVTIKEDRSFRYTVTLKEGMNSVLMEIEDKDHRTSRKILSIELKTKGPTIIVDQKSQTEKWVAVSTVALTGKVDPGSVVTVNGTTADVIGNAWKATISVLMGKNKIQIQASDELGNDTKEDLEVYVYARRKIELFVGSKEGTIDGKPLNLTEPPFIQDGRTFIPLKLIVDAFGSVLSWNPETRGITIQKDGIKIEMIVGSSKAMVNDKIVDMDAPPVIRNAQTFVPVRFVSEILGADVTWNARIKLIFIEILV